MKKSIKYILFFAAVLTIFLPNAYATNGMRMIGFGPVQRSMGGASVGATLDAASLITNPAGMSDLGGRVDFGATYFSAAVEYNATGVNIPAGAMGNVAPIKSVKNDGETKKSDRGGSPVPAFGLVIPINDSLKFGIGAYGISGMGVDYEDNLYFGTTYSSYSQMRFTPGVSYKIMKELSIGAVVNLMYATMEFDAASGFGQAAHMGASSFGIGGTIGIKYTPLEMLSLGIAYETKSFFQDFRFNVNSATVGDPMSGTNTTYPSGVDKLEFNQPSVATFGLAIKPIAGLTIAADLEWIRWSETNGKNKPKFEKSQPYTTAWNLNWNDRLVYKIGIQYQVIPMLALRAGYNYGKMPLDKTRAFENMAFPAVAEHHITAGLGVKLGEKFEINLGGMYSPKASITGSNPMNQYIVSYKTSMSQYSLELGLSYML